MKIVGISLVRNEEFFVEWSLRSALPFCDELLVADHGSTDRTPEILRELEAEFRGKLVVKPVKRPGESHRWIEDLAGSATWVFGVDGDEIYDPAGLSRLRSSLDAGDLDKSWAVFGNVLNVRGFDGSMLAGHLSPPCRSMTKLYNFRAIEAWRGPTPERLHGGRLLFRAGWSEKARCGLHEEYHWESSPFRCLHLCFSRRSCGDQPDKVRDNIMDRHERSWKKLVDRMRAILLGVRPQNWKQAKYARGELVRKSVEPFLQAAAECQHSDPLRSLQT